APTPTDEHPEIAQLIAEGKWGGTPTPTKTATVPQTSDNSNPMLWVVMLVLAAAGLAGVVVLKKRQHNK
ncbi:MAG: LPXTG cell wall anchor domain-containing protein, partial [Gemmiger sp.]